MNGVLSLVHFCEAHGPTVMFSTQLHHQDQPARSLINFSANLPPQPPSANTNLQKQSTANIETYFKDFSFNSSLLSSSLYSLFPSSFSTAPQIPPKPTRISAESIPQRPAHLRSESLPYPKMPQSSSNCTTCSVHFQVPNQAGNSNNNSKAKGFISTDPEDSELLYTTTKYPSHPQLYAALRQACVRSLSTEFCPGREGPIMFGDEKHGYLLSYLFKVRDDQARGSQRVYSINFLMTDRHYLVASFTYLVSKFRAIVKFLQNRAESRVDSLLSSSNPDCGRNSKVPSINNLSNHNTPPTSPISPSFKSLPTLHRSPTFNSGDFTSTLTSDQYLRRRSSQKRKELRTLEELVNVPDLIITLHLAFSTILRTGSKRITESIPVNTWDRWVEPTTVNLDILPVSDARFHSGSMSSDVSSITPGTPPSEFRIHHLGQLKNHLDVSQFSKLIYNLVIGNQVVIRSSYYDLVKQIIAILQDLLPHSLYNIMEYESHYQPSYLTNLIGLKEDAIIPSDLDTSSFVLLNISPPNHSDDTMGYPKFSLQYGAQVPKESQNSNLGYLTRLLTILNCHSSFSKSPNTLIPTSYFLSQPNPATSNNPSSPSSYSAQHLRLKVIGLKEEWSCKGRIFAQYLRSKSMLGADPSVDLSKFLTLIKVAPSDLPILRLFATVLKPGRK